MDTKLVFKSSALEEKMVTTESFQDMITIMHVDAARMQYPSDEVIPKLLSNANTFLMILVQNGHAEISVDYKTYHITSDKLAFLIPNHVFRINEMSHDFKARFLVIDKYLLEEITRDKKGSYNYITFKRTPLITLEKEEKNNMDKAFLILQDKIKSRAHLFYRDIVHNAAIGLLLEFMSIIVPKNRELVHQTLTRQEDIVSRFLTLLSEHAREQHMLSFYADKLFITPQYLSSILKEQTGKSGSKWINEALIMEAKKLIKSPSTTIQDVAYTLNFSDQSTFGKFFKKSLGISPLVFRRIG